MANNYTHFSEVIPDLTPEEMVWIEEILLFDPDDHDFITDEQARAYLAGMLTCEVEALRDIEIDSWPGFDWKIEDEQLYLSDDGGCADLETLIIFVREFICRFRPEMVFKLTWAGTCNTPRIGEFGGGWIVISANTIKSDSTWAAANSAVEYLKLDLEDRCPHGMFYSGAGACPQCGGGAVPDE